VFLKKPSVPGLAKQENTPRRKNLVTSIIMLKGEPNAAGSGARLFHGENRSKYIGSTSSNNTWVRALDICPEAIKGSIAGPILRVP